MTISVVIPCYNAADTIRDAIASVRAQTRPADEIIVVDDGSRDDTAGIVQREFPECRLVRQANAGPAAARNRGVETARGDWIAFLDGDDLWFSWHLETIARVSSRWPDALMFCGDALRWMPGADGQPPTLSRQAVPPGSRRVTLDELAEHNPVATSTVLLQKRAWQETGGFDGRFRGPEDYDLWIRVAARGTIVFIEGILAVYRVKPGSLSLDDLRFLDQVLGVIAKAYATDGALNGRGHRRQAEGYQYLCCAWMAGERGDRRRALGLWGRSCLRWPWPYRGRWRRLPWAQLRLLVRLLVARAAVRSPMALARER